MTIYGEGGPVLCKIAHQNIGQKVIFDKEEGTVLNKVDSGDLFWLHVLTVRDSVLHSNKIGHFDCFI